MAIPYISVTGVAIVTGVLGNSLILGAFWINPKLQQGAQFVVNLALADLCVVTLADPLCILGMGWK